MLPSSPRRSVTLPPLIRNANPDGVYTNTEDDEGESHGLALNSKRTQPHQLLFQSSTTPKPSQSPFKMGQEQNPRPHYRHPHRPQGRLPPQIRHHPLLHRLHHLQIYVRLAKAPGLNCPHSPFHPSLPYSLRRVPSPQVSQLSLFSPHELWYYVAQSGAESSPDP